MLNNPFGKEDIKPEEIKEVIEEVKEVVKKEKSQVEKILEEYNQIESSIPINHIYWRIR